MKELWLKNKSTIIRSLLILFPVLAVGLATAGDSVQVFDTAAKTYSYGSFFTPVPVESLAMLPPLAGASALLAFFGSVLYTVKKNEKYLTLCKYTSTAGALCAAIPPMIRGQQMIVLPNALFPLLLLCNLLVVLHLQKQAEKEKAGLEASEQKKKKNKKKK